MSMPRSGCGSVVTGRSDAMSVGSAVTRHWVNSVSDIYGPDEIEELLDDLNRLEMASLSGMRPTSSEMNIMASEAVISGCITQPPAPDHDLEDFDIDGSQVKQPRRQQFDGGGMVPGHQPPHEEAVPPSSITANSHRDLARRSTHRLHNRRGSSSWSVRSWDSHAHYQGSYQMDEVTNAGGQDMEDEEEEDEEDQPPRLFSNTSAGVLCYCDMSTFKTPRTVLRVLLVVTSIACLSTVLTAGTAKMGLFSLPHFPRLRIMLFITVFTVIFTIFILFLNISHLYALLPVDYGKMQTVVYLLLTVAYVVASSLVFHAHLDDSFIPSLTPWTSTLTLVVALLGFLCGLETFLCSFNCVRLPDKMGESSTHFTLHETMTTSQSRSRPVTEDSLAKRVQTGGGGAGAGSSAPAAPASSAVAARAANFEERGQKLKKGSSANNEPEMVSTQATVEASVHKSTGAIPKKKATVASKASASAANKKSATNHLDEILALPIDDTTTQQQLQQKPANGKTVPS